MGLIGVSGMGVQGACYLEMLMLQAGMWPWTWSDRIQHLSFRGGRRWPLRNWDYAEIA